MVILSLLQSNLLSGVALLLTLAAILGCLALLRKVRGSYNRILIGLVGMTAAYQGLRILQGAGILSARNHDLDGVVNLFITAFLACTCEFMILQSQ